MRFIPVENKVGYKYLHILKWSAIPSCTEGEPDLVLQLLALYPLAYVSGAEVKEAKSEDFFGESCWAVETAQKAGCMSLKVRDCSELCLTYTWKINL